MNVQDQVHLTVAYVNVRSAMDELSQVRQKDKYLFKIQRTLYNMEDILYQYISIPRKKEENNGTAQDKAADRQRD